MQTQKLIFERWLSDFSCAHERMFERMSIDVAKKFIIIAIKDYGYDVELRCDTHVYGHPAILNIPDEPYISNYEVCSIVANYIASKKRKLFGEMQSPRYCRIYAETLSKISSINLSDIVNSMLESGLNVEDVVE